MKQRREVIHRRVCCLLAAAVLTFGAGIVFIACDDDDDGPDTVGQPCKAAEECYPRIDQSELSGAVVCMDRVEGGYCTHHCQSDADCCAIEGECDDVSNVKYVCGPFESTGEMYCFISCEGQEDGNAFCQKWAHREFICRSTGGGSKNRKVCVPGG